MRRQHRLIFGSLLLSVAASVGLAGLIPTLAPAQSPTTEAERAGIAGFEFGMTPWQARDRCGSAHWSFLPATDRRPLAEGRCGQAASAYSTFTPRSVRLTFCPSEAGPARVCRFWTSSGGFHLRELLLQLTRKYGNPTSREAGEELETDARCAERELTQPELEGESALSRPTRGTKAPRGATKRPGGATEEERGPWEPERSCTRWVVADNATEAERAHRIELSTGNIDGSFTMWETRLEYRAGGFEEAHRATVEAIRERLRGAL